LDLGVLGEKWMSIAPPRTFKNQHLLERPPRAIITLKGKSRERGCKVSYVIAPWDIAKYQSMPRHGLANRSIGGCGGEGGVAVSSFDSIPYLLRDRGKEVFSSWLLRDRGKEVFSSWLSF